ncbi:putative NAD(P)H dehydrogenase (quinone) FQR1-like 3 isoform X3 [Tasmannia lanceolata]|uniref:putative NAD(P)H dehydrogenase (quinone) FQR1-like 3 isoform X3 n=1 Tax=Tasmannia lanceolata TaxID=3420 RepID=UPI004064B49A
MTTTTTTTTTKVYIMLIFYPSYYSLYGHVVTMAREIHRGANSVQGVEATLWQVPETLSEEVLEKMKAPPKENDVAVIKTQQLVEADAFIFGFPSRFGMMPAQFMAFFDDTHDLWGSQSLAGKPAGIFWSTGFHGGGQENTACRMAIQQGNTHIECFPHSQRRGNSTVYRKEMQQY